MWQHSCPTLPYPQETQPRKPSVRSESFESSIIPRGSLSCSSCTSTRPETRQDRRQQEVTGGVHFLPPNPDASSAKPHTFDLTIRTRQTTSSMPTSIVPECTNNVHSTEQSWHNIVDAPKLLHYRRLILDLTHYLFVISGELKNRKIPEWCAFLRDGK